MAVALAALYLDKEIHEHLIITGEASISGKLGSSFSIREKAMAGLENFPDVTVNMIIPRANTVVNVRGNTVDSAIWNQFVYVTRDREDPRTTLQREWVTFDKDERARLNVLAAETLYDVLELAIISPPGMVKCCSLLLVYLMMIMMVAIL